jgi:hypothetical protein
MPGETMLRRLCLLAAPALLAGCVSFSSSREAPAAPDYATVCQAKENQCRDTCGGAGVLAFSCRASPTEGLEYRCQCRQPGTRL